MNAFANPEMPVLGIVMGMARGAKGVPVEAVAPRSPSAAAGVRVGDVIQSLDGSPVRDGNKLQVMLAKRQPGDKVKLGILRDRRELEVEVGLVRLNTLFDER